LVDCGSKVEYQKLKSIGVILDGGMDRMVSKLQKDENARRLAGETTAA
jgi:hypothetical protein